jgi:ankyrin repeat protein
LKKGANLHDTDKDGVTPLMVACKAGREQTAKFILDTLGQNVSYNSADYVEKKFGPGGVDRPGKDSWCALHLAVVADQALMVVPILLKGGAAIDRPLSTRYDKMTPLMLAAANADLTIVRLLVEKGGARVEKRDRYRRTALTHAVMNGAANVTSYLLAIGRLPLHRRIKNFII